MFWQIIIVLSALGVLFILWPLVQLPFLHKSWVRHASQDETQRSLYKEHLADLDRALTNGEIEKNEYDLLVLELQKSLVDDGTVGGEQQLNRKGKKLVLALAVLVPVLSLFIYSRWGAKPDWEIYQEIQQLSQIQSQDAYEQKLRDLVLKSQARLNQTPENLPLRNLLAQTSMALQDYDEAVANYRQILESYPDSPQIIANLAQALFYRAGNTVTAEVRDYTQKALALAPNLPEMLGLAGIDAKNQGDLRGAIRYWKLAVSQLNPNSGAARGYRSGIENAERALIAAGETLEEPSASAEQGAVQSIAVQVEIAPNIQVASSTAVFVYARAWQGPKMPLAIVKLTVGDLPREITLDDTMAMAPGMTLGSFEELEIVARVSLAGSATAQSGDWQASLGPIKLSGPVAPIVLTIADPIP